MPTHAAFLRGVNLGAQRRASADQLRSLFEGMGFDGVATFRTSGNVVFAAGREAAPKLTARIEKELARALGFEVTIFLRTAREVRAIAGEQPFPRGAVETAKGKLQVALLPAKPATRTRNEALALATDEDRLALRGRELYWLPSGGTRDSALNQVAIEKLVGPWTMRTMGTLEQVAAKYFAG
jgi:uncharacterized protein (DUF1697 family)